MPEKTVYIRFFAGVDGRSIQSLLNVIDQKLREGANKFILLISSGGGQVSPGVAGYNYLKGIPAEVETHNFGQAASVALVLFCAGKRRLSVPHATFSIHAVQSNFSKGEGLEEKQLEERLKSLKLNIENIAGIIAANTGKDEKEVLANMINRETLNPEEAVKYGLVHEIKEALFEKGAEVISITDTQERVIPVKLSK